MERKGELKEGSEGSKWRGGCLYDLGEGCFLALSGDGRPWQQTPSVINFGRVGKLNKTLIIVRLLVLVIFL